MTEDNPIWQAVRLIAAAVKLVDVAVVGREVVAYEVISPEAEPPAVVIGPPRLNFQAQCPSATSADVVVFVVVDDNERAQEQLYALVPAVAEAIDRHVPNAVCEVAEPGFFPVGARELPAYSISVSINL